MNSRTKRRLAYMKKANKRPTLRNLSLSESIHADYLNLRINHKEMDILRNKAKSTKFESNIHTKKYANGCQKINIKHMGKTAKRQLKKRIA